MFFLYKPIVAWAKICEMLTLNGLIAGQFSFGFDKPKQWEPLYCNKYASNFIISFGFLCTQEEHETLFYKDKNLQSESESGNLNL